MSPLVKRLQYTFVNKFELGMIHTRTGLAPYYIAKLLQAIRSSGKYLKSYFSLLVQYRLISCLLRRFQINQCLFKSASVRDMVTSIL